jgi:1-acyl-sn-glycerol-3-phosphate acyltransferase
LIYRLGQLICGLVFATLGRWRVTGREHIPRTGAAILAANHLSYLDPPLLGSAIWRPAWFMAKAELFAIPGLKQLCRGLHAYPVRRGAADRAALKHTLDLLSHGEMVAIFPEGTRSKTGELGPPEVGVGMLTLRSRAPVVPIAISGTNVMLPRDAKMLRPARIRVKIGAPLQFPAPPSGRIEREVYAQVAQQIIDAIARLQREP